LFDSGVINLQIPMTKYIGFQYTLTVIVKSKHGIFRRLSCFN